MKYVRESAWNRWQAHITIGCGLPDCPRRKGIDVSLGTFSSEQEAYDFAIMVKSKIKDCDSYVNQRAIAEQFREEQKAKEKQPIFCCRTKILRHWICCPVCGKKYN